MPSILKIRRNWSLLHFEIRRDRSPHKILKIRRDWSLPFGEIGAFHSERLEPSIRRDWSIPSQPGGWDIAKLKANAPPG